MNGFGRALVVCVGNNTFEAGMRKMLEQTHSGPTPLQ